MDGWTTKKLSEICDIESGKAHEPFIHGYGEFICVTSKFISSEGKSYRKCYENLKPAKENDILMVLSDLPNGRALAKCLIVDQKNDGRFAVNQRIGHLKPTRIHPKFLYYLLNRNKYFLEFDDGVNQTNLSTKSIENCALTFPSSLIKQQAIAEALSDADTLISSLEKLIEKKQKIFNSLLSALIEIDDNGNATSASLNSGFQIKARIGWQGLTTKEYLEHGNYLLVTGTEFSDGNVSWEDCWRVEKERFDQDKNIQLKDNDVLITKDGTIGKVAQVNGLKIPATLNSGVFVIRPTTTEVIPRYLFYVFRSNLFKSFLNELSAGSTINHLYQKDIVKFKFLMPNSIARQQHIVRVLDEVKLEISLLSQQLDKAKKVKAGMMQELLTGRTRLI